jgi:23S rRNA (uracil1939-C5)-methyltransferase
VVDCDYCAIQSAPANAIAEAVRQYVEETGVSIYDEKSGIGMLRHVIVKSGFTTGEVMAIFVVNDDHLPKVERLVELCDDAVNALGTDEDWFWALESVILNINRSKGGEIMGKDCVTIAGKNTILDQIGDLTFEISPLSFYQVNPVQTVALYDKVKEFAGLTGEETILDLYCGVGTIGLYCAEGAARIIGVEVVKQAVIDANRNAVINGIVNAEYICGKAEEVLAKRLQGVKADVVILDPPRSGCDQALIDSVLKVAPKRIVYVSCDPATMARDIKVLTESDYKLEVAQPVDMFPHTANVECVCKLIRA